MKKKKKSPMRRKTKAIIGIIICLALAAANIALSGYTWTKEAALKEMMEYNATGELDIVSPLPSLGLKNKANYQFYLMENEYCFAMFSINHHLWHGWLDGPCLIAEKDSSQAVQLRYNSFSSSRDIDKDMLRIFGIIRDDEIERLEIEIQIAGFGEVSTLEKLTLQSESFIEYGGDRYVNIDHLFVYGLNDYLQTPFAVRGYNASGEQIYYGDLQLGQSTFLG